MIYLPATGQDLDSSLVWVDRNGNEDSIGAFGRPFVANPDLPERLRTGAALAPHDRNTLFGGGAKGLTDYPTLTQAAA